MTITRINEFQARADMINELQAFLLSIVPSISSSDGCLSCQVLQSHADPTQYVVLEAWDSIEAHQASAKAIPPEMFANVMQLLAGPPRGEYFSICERAAPGG